MSPAISSTAGAQPADSLPSRDGVPWVSAREWRTAGMAAATTAMLIPLDRPIALRVDRTLGASSRVVDVADQVSAVAQPAVLLSTVALLGIGRITHRPAIADAGMHGTEALVVASAVTGGAKRIVGRLRPYAVDDRRALTFDPFNGADHARSFPSGHATFAFTFAAVVQEELARHPLMANNRRARWLVTSLLYGTATAVSIARLAERDHWGSDLAAGAGVGILSARWTVRHRHARGANRFERWLTGVTP